MDIQEISTTMSNLEHQALEAFRANAEAFDAFDKGAAHIVRGLLQEVQSLNEQIAELKVANMKLAGNSAAQALDNIAHEPVDPEDGEEGIKIGGTD